MDSTEYEMVRNLTLLFFLERLMDKGGPRTLHDLSCQFGAKGFTKEMRQIAGGSQSGLKKFLSQYPSLFSIDGDQVMVNTFQPPVKEEDGCKSNGKRDYAQEAVEYFSNKLKQYGVGTEVPIRSLLGHRSQASPEVRHISGQHYKEFRAFLIKFPESFIVTGEDFDSVILKEYEGMKSEPFKELEPSITVDPEVTLRSLDFFAHCIECKGPTLVDQLFAMYIDRYVDESESLLKTAQDLSTFLKMFPDKFHVQSNLVTLLKPSKNSNSDVSQKSNKVSKSNSSENSGDSLSPPSSYINNQQQTYDTSSTASDRSSQPNSFHNTCPSPFESNNNSPPVSLQHQSLRQRINILVMKTLADNMEKDRGNIVTPQTGDAWKAKIIQQTTMVVNPKESLQIVDNIIKTSVLNGKTVVSFDLEGINIGAKGQLTLAQIGTVNGQAYIFDLFTSPNLMLAGGLIRLLQDENIIKVRSIITITYCKIAFMAVAF